MTIETISRADVERIVRDGCGDSVIEGGLLEAIAEHFATQPQAQGEPVAVVDCGEDGLYADILPDRTVKVGQMLYTHPAPAVDDADMFWDSDNPEESFSTDPHDLADSIADLGYPDEEPFEAVIDCAKRFPSRKMKIWSEKDEDGDYYTKWEWVK